METAGFLPLALAAEDYLELLPTRWQAINSYGIKVNHRLYDCDELNDLRREKSGIAERKNRWEVRHDPYDIRLVWLRNHRTGQWITVPWRLLSTTATPFGELAWDHTARDLRDQGEQVTEDAIAAAVGDLFDRAASGSDEEVGPVKPGRGRRSRRRGPKVVARTQATSQPAWPRPEPPLPPQADPTEEPGGDEEAEEENTVADVVPLKVFDARKEARKWW